MFSQLVNSELQCFAFSVFYRRSSSRRGRLLSLLLIFFTSCPFPFLLYIFVPTLFFLFLFLSLSPLFYIIQKVKISCLSDTVSFFYLENEEFQTNLCWRISWTRWTNWPVDPEWTCSQSHNGLLTMQSILFCWLGRHSPNYKSCPTNQSPVLLYG